MYYYFLFKGLWDRSKEGPSSLSRENLAHYCREAGEYCAMRNGPCTTHYRAAENEQIVAN